MLFTSIVAHLDAIYCMPKFNLETSMLPVVVEMLNLISLIFILISSIERSKFGNRMSSSG